MQASASSGTASRHTTTRTLTQYPAAEYNQPVIRETLQNFNRIEIPRELAVASSKLDMQNWTVTHNGMTLAQAFGVDKGKISFPKLGAKLPGASQEATIAQNLPVGDTSPPSAKDEHANYLLAMDLMSKPPYNWSSENQKAALNNVVMAESGWNEKAENPGSGAYGIPQALPGSKMASAGKDWQTDARTQIRWMLEYIRSRYGTPEAAWQFHLAHGWY
jgi:hypothetical protein